MRSRTIVALFLILHCVCGNAEEVPRLRPADIAEPRDPRDPLNWPSIVGDFRQSIRDRGIAFGGSLIWDGSQNFRGGVDTERFASRYLLDLNLTLSMEQWVGWDNATVFVDFQHHDYSLLGDAIVGDYQVFSNIDAPRRTQIPRVWIETFWLQDKLRLKAGKIDANEEFAYTLTGGGFLNSSMGFSPTIFTMPTYPDPAGGFVAQWRQGKQVTIRFGLFDGVGVTGVPTGSRYPTTLLDGFENLFLIGQTDWVWGSQSRGDLGRLSVGMWHHNGKFERYGGGIQNGATGWFATMDQWLWNEGCCSCHQDQGIAMFLQYGSADPEVSQGHQHIGIGLTWSGMIYGRDEDVLGIGLTNVDFSSASGATASNELAMEFFLHVPLIARWTATLDLQSIQNPGGYVDRRSALVSTLRLQREF